MQHGLHPPTDARPLLLIDIDGVISLFGFAPHNGPYGPSARPDSVRPATLPARPEGAFHTIDGIPHFLSTTAADHLRNLVSVYDPVWCSGWEEKAEEYLPHLLNLPRGWPHLSFERNVGGAQAPRAHWKLDAIDAHAGPQRPLAWLDDAFNDACHTWAQTRPGQTLLVQTTPATGLTEREAEQLVAWAAQAGSSSSAST